MRFRLPVADTRSTRRGRPGQSSQSRGAAARAIARGAAAARAGDRVPRPKSGRPGQSGQSGHPRRPVADWPWFEILLAAGVFGMIGLIALALIGSETKKWEFESLLETVPYDIQKQAEFYCMGNRDGSWGLKIECYQYVGSVMPGCMVDGVVSQSCMEKEMYLWTAGVTGDFVPERIHPGGPKTIPGQPPGYTGPVGIPDDPVIVIAPPPGDP